MRLYITHLNSDQQGKETILTILEFDKVVQQMIPFEVANLLIKQEDTCKYLDSTTVDVPESNPLVLRGGYDQTDRTLSLHVKCNEEPLLTLLAHCQEGHRFNPCAIVRTSSGAVIQFLVEADG